MSNHTLRAIITDANATRSRAAAFKEISPIYPKVHEVQREGVLWVTTLVPFTHNGKHYMRHHLESVVLTEKCGRPQVFERLHNACQMTQQFGQPVTGMDDEVTKP